MTGARKRTVGRRGHSLAGRGRPSPNVAVHSDTLTPLPSPTPAAYVAILMQRQPGPPERGGGELWPLS